MKNQTTRTLFLLIATGSLPFAAAQPAAPASPGNAVEEKTPESTYQAARDLLKGDGGEEATSKGFRMMLEAANQGHLPAVAGVAYLYSVGMGTPKDSVEAAKWFRIAAEKDHAVSQYNLGKLLVADEIPLPQGTVHRKTQHDEGVAWIRKAADQGLPDAQATYGIILYRGDFETKPDAAAGAGYLKPAADAGNLEAMNALGLMHQTGNGVAYDTAAAERFFRKAAMGGHAKAQANLGEQLDPLSQNTEQRIEAIAWLFISEAAKDPVAKKLLQVKSPAISPDDLAAARKKAAELRRKIREEKK